MQKDRFLLFRKGPSGEFKACGLLPLTEAELADQVRDLRTGHLVDPSVEFFKQPFTPVSVEI